MKGQEIVLKPPVHSAHQNMGICRTEAAMDAAVQANKEGVALGMEEIGEEFWKLLKMGKANGAQTKVREGGQGVHHQEPLWECFDRVFGQVLI